MKSPINIVLLTPGFASDEQDTIAIPSLQLFARFLKTHHKDINLQIVTFHYPAKSGSYTWNGIPVYPAGGTRNKLSRIFLWIKVLVILRRLQKKQGVDIIHSFWLTEASLIGFIFSKISGTKFLATSMGQDVKPENKYLRILRLFSFQLTVISQFQYEYTRYLKKAEVLKVVPFGTDGSYFNDLQVDRTIDILGVGSLNRIKNYNEFVQVIGSVVLVFPGIRCRIIGEGDKRPEIEKLIREKGLQDHIVLAGNLDYNKTIEEMQQGKILLHTSTFEGQALVITEALAAGLYVVSHPVGIAASLRSKKLMTGETMHDLARHVIDILQKQVLDFKPETHFTIDQTCNEYHEIYHDLLK